MPRLILRYCLIAGLFASSVFAAWSWFRPYSWSSDTGAGGKVLETLVTRDQSFFWVNVHLAMHPGATHDLQKKVYLETSRGIRLEPADTTFVGKGDQPVSEVWFKFWLESFHLEGPLTLHLNDGSLSIKVNDGLPDLGDSNLRNFVTDQW